GPSPKTNAGDWSTTTLPLHGATYGANRSPQLDASPASRETPGSSSSPSGGSQGPRRTWSVKFTSTIRPSSPVTAPHSSSHVSWEIAGSSMGDEASVRSSRDVSTPDSGAIVQVVAVDASTGDGVVVPPSLVGEASGTSLD